MARYEIGIIGAGVSGICAAIQLQRKFGGSISFTLFEQNSDVGGNWLKNVYPGLTTVVDSTGSYADKVTVIYVPFFRHCKTPRNNFVGEDDRFYGCACDISSHLYSFSFELNPNWSKNYPSQPEILDYLRGLTRKYKISEHIKFQHKVKTVRWNEEQMKWVVRYVDGSVQNVLSEESQAFDIILNGPGGLRVPLVPSELGAFTGPMMHTAEWNHEIDLKNKRVAVIGSGASAVQVIPRIADIADTMHCYQRRPPYIFPRLQFTFPNFMKTIFKYLPFVMWLYRCAIYVLQEFMYPGIKADSFLNSFGRKSTKAYREHELKRHQHLWNGVTPNYNFGCKRVLMSEQYYAAMARPNVHLHSEHIDKIVDRTIYTKDGSKEEVDVLILATGFRVSNFFGPLEVIGKGGKNILRSWTEDRPRSYFGVAFSDTPNYFYLFGPNTALGHSSVVFMIECQVNFVTSAIDEMMKRNAKVINVTKAVEDKFMDKLDIEMKNTIWGRESCNSFYENSRGDITVLWPNSTISYWWRLRNTKWSKFEFM